MSPMRKVFASLVVAGTLMVGGVACSSSNSGGSASVGDWCKRFEKVDKEEANSDLDESGKAFIALAKDAPAEIKKDMDLLASAFTALDGVDLEDPDAMKDIEAKFDENKVEKASDNIEAFVKKKCGYDLDKG